MKTIRYVLLLAIIVLCLTGCRHYLITRGIRSIITDDHSFLHFGTETTIVDSDWDLFMLKLVNRARLDPSGESARLGSSTIEERLPVPPLAYQRLVGNSAVNHNTFMHANLGQISSGKTPDSFGHYETVDGVHSSTPAVGYPYYTGVTTGQRCIAAGYQWGSVGENILTTWSGNPIIVNKAKITSNHIGWWNSNGHRNNMLSANFTVFGHKVESKSFVPPLGGLNAPADNILYATQVFASPVSAPKTYIFGILYFDTNGDGEWSPRDNGVGLTEISPLRDMDGDGDEDLRDYSIVQKIIGKREGFGGEPYEVRASDGGALTTQDTTMGNGAFSTRVGMGKYDIVFSRLGVSIRGVTVLGTNVDVGEISVILKARE
jgi:hypothetical protein